MHLSQLSTNEVPQSYSRYAYPNLMAAALLAYGANMAVPHHEMRDKALWLTDATTISTSTDAVQESYHVYRDIPAADEGELLLTLKTLYAQFASSRPNSTSAFYTTKDDSHVAEFFCEDSRVTCVVREKYAHVMSFVNATFTDRTFEKESYSLQAVANLTETLLNNITRG